MLVERNSDCERDLDLDLDQRMMEQPHVAGFDWVSAFVETVGVVVKSLRQRR